MPAARCQPTDRFAARRVVSVTVAWSCLPVGVTQSTRTDWPTLAWETSKDSVMAFTTRNVRKPVMVSPLAIPALAAGDVGTTPSTCAPATADDVDLGADGAVADVLAVRPAGRVDVGAISTPRNASFFGVALPVPGNEPGVERGTRGWDGWSGLTGDVGRPEADTGCCVVPQVLKPIPMPKATSAAPASVPPTIRHTRMARRSRPPGAGARLVPGPGAPVGQGPGVTQGPAGAHDPGDAQGPVAQGPGVAHGPATQGPGVAHGGSP